MRQFRNWYKPDDTKCRKMHETKLTIVEQKVTLVKYSKYKMQKVLHGTIDKSLA